LTICEQCGAPGQSGESFCGTCGAYLEWQEPASVTGPAAPPAGPPAATAPGTGHEAAAVDEAVVASVRPADPAGRADSVEPARHSPSPRERVEPVRPGAAAPRPRRRELPVEDRRPLPGETICPACGAGNVPTRRFCRRCGADLVDALAVPELPWYRRLFRRTPRPARAAGDRPTRRRSMRGLDRRLGILVLLVVIVVGGWFGRARVAGVVDLARDRLSQEIVHATRFAASSEARGHPAEAVNDGAPNSYWSPRSTGTARGESVTLGLAAPVRLAYVNIFNGPSSEKGKSFLATPRVSVVRLSMTRSNRQVVQRTIELRDAPGGQEFHLGVDDVRSVKVTVLGAHGAKSDKRVALGEVELFKRT
jgi:hypothetical protein